MSLLPESTEWTGENEVTIDGAVYLEYATLNPIPITGESTLDEATCEVIAPLTVATELVTEHGFQWTHSPSTFPDNSVNPQNEQFRFSSMVPYSFCFSSLHCLLCPLLCCATVINGICLVNRAQNNQNQANEVREESSILSNSRFFSQDNQNQANERALEFSQNFSSLPSVVRP